MARFDGGDISSDGGSMLLRATEDRLLVQVFLESYTSPPEEIVLDLSQLGLSGPPVVRPSWSTSGTS